MGIFMRRRMTDEDRIRYNKELVESECFDVHPPRVPYCGLIGPVSGRRRTECERFSLLAIEEYNRRSIPGTSRLALVKVTKAMFQIRFVARYYITFEAKEKDSAGGQSKTYQAVVNQPPPRGGAFSVLSFRECEQEQGSGNIRGKEWLWKGHTF
ncbi:uncharacterized protein LOC133868674 isoform X2 [Alnus glutinosa]|uniref:uncharacterized protein LOC133868674 isoform X2 n=1 Tax=Alnus glutinosa TaxID=3517 RepID=UPI002D790128|nr:uncharacterized protein LOC133868674 isoform X2 [Alnus glutinosa]XP_062161615.1 uncharacterized protein LOC133868674 isoform X2 [Alnus glutinosa]XP_062161616.1 uncharacterized protein LOC133868674 isoform X2 [Alnus glutinosa]XP_062161617.1 uncharacterized protein LOC133868674 isoform X2 [Alnus glutinosa]XP_062161618.1 uncharacterized protein LOC133868674 isoform X2 [Alnus glutinosa]XP_062161619.1 uncharacterized protein LOC133868674 isoform X2 [Alnus glutinosa]XP_062161620.1 uncharacterize